MVVGGGGVGGDVEMCSIEDALIVAGNLVHSQYWHLRIVTKGREKEIYISIISWITPSVLESETRALGPQLRGLYVRVTDSRSYNECEQRRKESVY